MHRPVGLQRLFTYPHAASLLFSNSGGLGSESIPNSEMAARDRDLDLDSGFPDLPGYDKTAKQKGQKAGQKAGGKGGRSVSGTGMSLSSATLSAAGLDRDRGDGGDGGSVVSGSGLGGGVGQAAARAVVGVLMKLLENLEAKSRWVMQITHHPCVGYMPSIWSPSNMALAAYRV